MIQAVFTLGAVLTVLVLIINLVVLKTTNKKSFAAYYTSIFFVIVGLLLLAVASVAPKVDLLGAGFGGWGIASLFAAAIGFIITSIVDAYQQSGPVEEA